VSTIPEGEPQYLYLTTIGWRSGKPHRIEIWFTTHEGRWYILAEHGDRAHWVQNVRHNPRVSFAIGDREYRGLANIVDESSDQARAAQARARSQEKYGWGGGAIVELSADEIPA
jgi:deazaflavin-dependent oxidoreductase (nitroreductase family)